MVFDNGDSHKNGSIHRNTSLKSMCIFKSGFQCYWTVTFWYLHEYYLCSNESARVLPFVLVFAHTGTHISQRWGSDKRHQTGLWISHSLDVSTSVYLFSVNVQHSNRNVVTRLFVFKWFMWTALVWLTAAIKSWRRFDYFLQNVFFFSFFHSFHDFWLRPCK